MSDLSELEKQVFAKPKTASVDELDLLARGYYDKANNEPNIREKVKPMKQANYFAAWAVIAGANDVGKLKWDLDLFKEASKIHASGGLAVKAKSLAISRVLELSGLGQATVISEVKGLVQVESGVIVIGDPEFRVKDGENINDNRLAEMGKQGRGMFVSTGGDGTFKGKIRLIDSPEPVLEKDEYKKMEDSQEGMIEIKTGEIKMADLWDLDQPRGIALKLDLGKYKIGVYFFDNSKFFGYVAVLCKDTH